MKFGRRSFVDVRRQRPMDISSRGENVANSGGSAEVMSLAGTTSMTCDNEGTTIDGDIADDFDDFCFGGGDEDEVEKSRQENGECPECGVKCFEVNACTGEKVALNIPGSIDDGVCLMCLVSDPTNVTDVNGSRTETARNSDGEVIITQAEYRVEFEDVSPMMHYQRCNSTPAKVSPKRPSFSLLGNKHRQSVSFGRGLKALSAKCPKHQELEDRLVKAELELRSLKSEASVLSCVSELLRVLDIDASLSNTAVMYGVVPASLAAMKKFRSNGKIQMKAARLLASMTQGGEEISLEMVACNQGVATLVESSKAHTAHCTVVRDILYALYRASALPRNAAEIVAIDERGGLKFLLSLLMKFELDEFIPTYIVGVLYQISKMQISWLTEEETLIACILQVVRRHRKSRDMRRVACKLLHLLASEGSLDVRTKLVDLDANIILLRFLKSSSSSEDVARYGMLTMAALVVSSAKARAQIVGKDGKGVSIILNCMKKYQDNVHVQTEGCRLVKFLCMGQTESLAKSTIQKKSSKRKIVQKAQDTIRKETGSLSNKLALSI